MTNRNPVKQLFITFPHSNVDKVAFRDDLLRFEPNYYKVCEEKHKDGSPHLHAVVRFKNKYSKAYVIKYFKEKYPDDYKRIDVKPVRSIKNSIAYLSKEDENPLVSGEFEDTRRPQDNLRDKFARELGYDNTADLLSRYRSELETREKYKRLIHNQWLINLDQDFDTSWKSEQIFEKLFADMFVSKDDITFLMKELNIEL